MLNMPYTPIQESVDPTKAKLRADLSEAAEGRSDEETLQAFHALLADSLGWFLQRPMTQVTTRQIQAAIDLAFREAQMCRAVLMFAEGAVYVGATPIMKPELHRYDLRWKTEFLFGPRWIRQPGDAMPLGFFGNYDLYIGFQEPLPPTLIARYGNGGGDYLTFNPYLQRAMWLANMPGPEGDALSEALLRARSAGWFDDLDD